MKNEKIPKEKEEISQVKNSKNKITNKHLTNLDNFIQQCLDKFKFVDPKQEFYDITGNEKDLIISHKSTIPDLVIWNKKFDKNECFEEGSNCKKVNLFPRFQFYLRIKSNKLEKHKLNKKSSKKIKDDNKKEKIYPKKNINKKKDKDKDKNKNKKNKEKKENKKNKKNKDKKNGSTNTNINSNDNNDVISNINCENISKSEKKILDLSELDINKIKEYNPRHKNNFFSSNKEIMNLNDNNSLLNDNKDKSKILKEIGINREIPSNEKNKLDTLQQKDYFNLQSKIGQNNNYNKIFYPNESQGSGGLNITINNNNYIQHYQLNNNNNINRFININKNNDLNFKDNNNINYPLENIYLDNKLKENQILNLININDNLKNWLVIEKNNGNVIGIFNSLELYLHLSKNTSSLINYSIREKNSQIILSGDKMLKILLQYYDYNINNNLFQYNQLEKIRQQMKQNNLRSKQNVNKRNKNQMNINLNNNFNDNSLNRNINNFDFNLNDNNIKVNSNLDYTDNMNHLNYLMRNINLLDYNKLNNNNNMDNNLSLENNNNKNIYNNLTNNNIINPNIKNINLNTNKYNNKENDLFNPDNFFNPKGMTIFTQNQNQDQKTNNLSAKEQNLETFNSSNNINSFNNYSNNYFTYFVKNDNNQKQKEKEIENEDEKNIIEIDDKIDNEDYNFENFIFNSHNKNPNSKSNKENAEDININDLGQFEPNNVYQNDNYNSIFS